MRTPESIRTAGRHPEAGRHGRKLVVDMALFMNERTGTETVGNPVVGNPVVGNRNNAFVHGNKNNKHEKIGLVKDKKDPPGRIAANCVRSTTPNQARNGGNGVRKPARNGGPVGVRNAVRNGGNGVRKADRKPVRNGGNLPPRQKANYGGGGRNKTVLGDWFGKPKPINNNHHVGYGNGQPKTININLEIGIELKKKTNNNKEGFCPQLECFLRPSINDEASDSEGSNYYSCLSEEEDDVAVAYVGVPLAVPDEPRTFMAHAVAPPGVMPRFKPTRLGDALEQHQVNLVTNVSALDPVPTAKTVRKPTGKGGRHFRLKSPNLKGKQQHAKRPTQEFSLAAQKRFAALLDEHWASVYIDPPAPCGVSGPPHGHTHYRDTTTPRRVRKEKWSGSRRRSRKGAHKKEANQTLERFEQAASSKGMLSPFQGNCYGCGKLGHKSHQCFKGRCYSCGRYGHKQHQCATTYAKGTDVLDEWLKCQKNSYSAVYLDEDNDIALMAGGGLSRFGRTVAICDSGASSHLLMTDEGMFDVKEVDSLITIGNGKTLRATKIGKVRRTVLQEDGTTMDIVLRDVKCVPGLKVNLFSLTKALSTGWNVSNDGVKIILRKGRNKITFDKVFETGTGVLCGVDLLPVTDTANLAGDTDNNTPPSKRHWDINTFHRTFNHASDEKLRATAKKYDWTLSGKLDPCRDCQISNITKRDVPKGGTEDKATANGERIFIDGTSVKTPSMGGNKYWVAVVDDKSSQTWSIFMKRKNDQVPRLMTFLRKMKARGTPVRRLRCDNAGENKSLQQACLDSNDDDLVNIQFEFTSRESPEYNGKAERKIAVLFERARVALNAAQLPKKLHHKLWAEVATTVTDTENLLVSSTTGESPYTAFHGKDMPAADKLRQFGEIGIVKIGKKLKGKLTDRGVPMMYLGRAQDHAGDTYRFLHLGTERVYVSRDVIWMNQVYGSYKGTNLPPLDDTVTLLPHRFTDEAQFLPCPQLFLR